VTAYALRHQARIPVGKRERERERKREREREGVRERERENIPNMPAAKPPVRFWRVT